MRQASSLLLFLLRRTALPKATPSVRPSSLSSLSSSPSLLRQSRTKSTHTKSQQPGGSGSGAYSSSSSSGKPPRWKAMLWTGLFAACTITGTFYGAGLKTQQEWKDEKQKVLEATIDERIAMLESRRQELSRQADELESKIAGVQKRIDAAAAAAGNKASG